MTIEWANDSEVWPLSRYTKRFSRYTKEWRLSRTFPTAQRWRNGAIDRHPGSWLQPTGNSAMTEVEGDASRGPLAVKAGKPPYYRKPQPGENCVYSFPCSGWDHGIWWSSHSGSHHRRCGAEKPGETGGKRGEEKTRITTMGNSFTQFTTGTEDLESSARGEGGGEGQKNTQKYKKQQKTKPPVREIHELGMRERWEGMCVISNKGLLEESGDKEENSL